MRRSQRLLSTRNGAPLFGTAKGRKPYCWANRPLRRVPAGWGTAGRGHFEVTSTLRPVGEPRRDDTRALQVCQIRHTRHGGLQTVARRSPCLPFMVT